MGNAPQGVGEEEGRRERSAGRVERDKRRRLAAASSVLNVTPMNTATPTSSQTFTKYQHDPQTKAHPQHHARKQSKKRCVAGKKTQMERRVAQEFRHREPRVHALQSRLVGSGIQSHSS